MGRRPSQAKGQQASAAETTKVLPVKFYPRFLYLVDQLARIWNVPDGNRSETVRECINRYAANPLPPHIWAKARPRQPRAPRAENPVRPRRLEAPEGPAVEQHPFNPVLTLAQIDHLTRWADAYQSNRTAVMYEAVWQAALTEGLIDPDAQIDLHAPPGWDPVR